MQKIFLFLFAGVFVETLFFLPLTILGAETFIDINTATLEQLDEITGIGPKYGQAIIDGRPYFSLDDLIRVKGIGEKTLQKIKDQGLACVVCPREPEKSDTSDKSDENASSSDSSDDSDFSNVSVPPPAPKQSNYPSGIFVNEIMPSPIGPDADNEWFELYNANNFSVNLSGWQIKDTQGAIKTYTIKNASLKPFGFLVIYRPESKITLQNTGDGLVLLNPNDKIIDQTEFDKASQDQAWAKTNDSWQWTTTPTPGLKNIITQPISEVAPSEFATNASATYPAASTANILQALPKKSQNIVYILLGFVIALSCGVFVLYLKSKTENN